MKLKVNDFRKFRGAAILIVAFVSVSACTTPIDIELNPSLDKTSEPKRLPLTVGVYHAPKFRVYKKSIPYAPGAPVQRPVVFPLGPASVKLFNAAYRKMFGGVVQLKSPPSSKTKRSDLSFVIEPEVEDFEFNRFRTTFRINHWARIRYKIKLRSPSGDPLGSWSVGGRGEESMRSFSEFDPYTAATERAMREAVGRFVSSFSEVPEAIRAARGLPLQAATAPDTGLRAKPAKRFGQDPALGDYEGIVRMTATPLEDAKGKIKDFAIKLTGAGLFALRVKIENIGKGTLIVRRHNMVLVTDKGRVEPIPATEFVNTLTLNEENLGSRGYIPPPPVGSPAGQGAAGLFQLFVMLVSAMPFKEAHDSNMAAYGSRELKDTTLAPQESVEGLVFFRVPRTLMFYMADHDLDLEIPVIEPATATRYIVRLKLGRSAPSFKAHDVKAGGAKKKGDEK